MFGKVDTAEMYQLPKAYTIACPQAIQLITESDKEKLLQTLFALVFVNT